MNLSIDETMIREIVQSLEAAWNIGDGQAFGAPFSEDADYTVWNGQYANGREAITREHQRLFETVFRGTVQRLEVEKIRFLREDVAVVHALGGMVDFEPERWPKVKPLLVLVKADGKWHIDVFHNTPVVTEQTQPPPRTIV
jgi:uncharacterized protein (TIGR02246 family)